MLCLERDGAVTRVDAPLLTDHMITEAVAGVDLNSRLGGEDLEQAAAHRIIETRCECRLLAGIVIEYEVMVVASADPELFVILANPIADGRRVAEVEWRAGDVA